MLLYAGKLSEEPYYIKEADINVYSLEELNFFVYNHMNLVYRDFFCAPLFDFIEKKLGRESLADRLRSLDAQGASLRSLISCFLKESCCYDNGQLSQVSAFVMNIDNITVPERTRIEGDKLFKAARYSAALSVYTGILDSAPFAPEGEFYAETAYAAGSCYARLFLCENACEYFGIAYDIFPKHDYALSSVCLSLILDNEKELLKAIIRYEISDEELAEMKSNVKRLKKNLESSAEFAAFSNEVRNPETAADIVCRYKDEYYRMTE